MNRIFNKMNSFVLLAPAFLIYTSILIIPMGTLLYYSFTKWNIVSDQIKFLGLDNFRTLLTNDWVFGICLKNTFLLAGASILIQMPLAILLSVLLTSKVKFKVFFKAAFNTPYIMSNTAVGLLWLFIYNMQFGLLNSLLRLVGLEDWVRPWLGDGETAMYSVIFVILWVYLGYHVTLISAAIENLPDSYYEVANIDGASWFQKMIYITLPLIKPVLKVDALFIITGAFKSFDLIYVMTKGGPNHASEVIASHMYFRAFRGMQYGYGSAIGVILLIISFIAVLIINRVFRYEEFQYS